MEGLSLGRFLVRFWREFGAVQYCNDYGCFGTFHLRIPITPLMLGHSTTNLQKSFHLWLPSFHRAAATAAFILLRSIRTAFLLSSWLRDFGVGWRYL